MGFRGFIASTPTYVLRCVADQLRNGTGHDVQLAQLNQQLITSPLVGQLAQLPEVEGHAFQTAADVNILQGFQSGVTHVKEEPGDGDLLLEKGLLFDT